ncbi:hypothetical protein RF11_14955 [Thelohanellus kitauei]|uniref:Sec16 Sec23-binding domain-containing protein n=1 Tax=Thelohanellus kitauei TaxID=669202 RepID=A0A0C2N371_THEKT|nr:hypothetical protein RF11_14955 [Thelohanellus kitauei]
MSEISDFPGPLNQTDSNIRSLIKYFKNQIPKLRISSPSTALLWELLMSIVKAKGFPDFCDLSEILFGYTDKLTTPSLFWKYNSNQLNDMDHFTVLYSLVTRDNTGAISKAVESSNWGLVFAISMSDPVLLKEALTKYINQFDQHDLLRLYLAVKSNTPIDISFVQDSEIVKNWNQYVALFLSEYTEHNVCRTYIYNIAKILQSKGRWDEYQICIILLDLLIESNTDSLPALISGAHFGNCLLDVTTQDILHLRTMEIYESIKLIKDPNFYSIQLQEFKMSFAGILALSDEKHKALDYLNSIAASILRNGPQDYQHFFINELIRLSTDLFHVIFQTNKYPDWLLKLNDLECDESGVLFFKPASNDALVSDKPNSENPSNIQVRISSSGVTENNSKESDHRKPSKPDQRILETEASDRQKCIDETKHPVTSEDMTIPMQQTSQVSRDFQSVPVLPAYNIRSPLIANEQIEVKAGPSLFIQNNQNTLQRKVETLSFPQNQNIYQGSVRMEAKPPAPTAHSFTNLVPQTLPQISTQTTTENTGYKASQAPVKTKSQNHVQTASTQSQSNDHDKLAVTTQAGFFSGATKIFGKIFKPRDASFLPDDSDPQIVYDETLKRYVDKSNPEGNESNITSPPPMSIPFINKKEDQKTDHNSRKNRYVAPTY